MKDHIHAYHRKKLGKSTIYKCQLPDCNHFIQKALAENRKCICSRCGYPFIITKRTLKSCPANLIVIIVSQVLILLVLLIRS